MREALRHYFDSRVPEITPTRAEWRQSAAAAPKSRPGVL